MLLLSVATRRSFRCALAESGMLIVWPIERCRMYWAVLLSVMTGMSSPVETTEVPMDFPSRFPSPRMQSDIGVCDLSGAAVNESGTARIVGVVGCVRFRQLMSWPAQRIETKWMLSHFGSSASVMPRIRRPGCVFRSPSSGIAEDRINRNPPAPDCTSPTSDGGPCLNAATVTSVKHANAIKPIDSTLRAVCREALRTPNRARLKPAAA